ncbi:TauD/TfdA family dioxygenase [Tenacibaculum sp. M341]|uniref:TauD/TfdA family dioxygenase n=1 Tax=Tenacibaculum sp. M341 TaxID=2530339 RepID=UPI0010494593|nr:TauD/TfdA family dioxygenase [Tenacibaculum sp. M341]TCI85720.1 TauD/TfdA family dioxygenase [Tenacibaculum sp. M341]
MEKETTISAEELSSTLGVDISISTKTGVCPVIITTDTKENGIEWAKKAKDEINELLLEHGAVLLRGFDIKGASDFNTMFKVFAGDPLEYKNRTSPRDKVYENVYTSTSHPKDQEIHMHTENSYSKTFNRLIAFFCLVPPDVRGETPIVDERKLFKYLTKETLDAFRERGVKYVRNTIPGVGLDWKTIYQTEDKTKVNKYLEENDIAYEWIGDDHLRIQWVLPAIQRHPITNEEVWFNHMYFGHKSLYDPMVLEFFEEKDLPFVTYFGDGSEITDEVIQEFKDFYKEHTIDFSWQKDDFLLLDNMMFAHGRRPFDGKRTILTIMSQPHQFDLDPK